MLKCLVCSHVDNIKESSNNEGKRGKKISLYYRLKCNKLRGVLRSLMETAPIYTRSEITFQRYLRTFLQLLPISPDNNHGSPQGPDHVGNSLFCPF
jgi:hypothetical protein